MPDDAIGLIICGPKSIFLDKEVAMIRNFINRRNGNLLLAIDPIDEISLTDRPALGLRPLLKEWGLRCHDMLVYDPNRQNFDLFSGSYFFENLPTGSIQPSR